MVIDGRNIFLYFVNSLRLNLMRSVWKCEKLTCGKNINAWTCVKVKIKARNAYQTSFRIFFYHYSIKKKIRRPALWCVWFLRPIVRHNERYWNRRKTRYNALYTGFLNEHWERLTGCNVWLMPIVSKCIIDVRIQIN